MPKKPETGNYNQPVDNIGHVMEVEDFISCCKMKGFIDYDGFGYPIKNNMADEDITIFPSKRYLIPKDATHIIWYNR